GECYHVWCSQKRTATHQRHVASQFSFKTICAFVLVGFISCNVPALDQTEYDYSFLSADPDGIDRKGPIRRGDDRVPNIEITGVLLQTLLKELCQLLADNGFPGRSPNNVHHFVLPALSCGLRNLAVA